MSYLLPSEVNDYIPDWYANDIRQATYYCKQEIHCLEEKHSGAEGGKNN
jgi:hypothetical protein